MLDCPVRKENSLKRPEEESAVSTTKKVSSSSSLTKVADFAESENQNRASQPTEREPPKKKKLPHAK